MRWLEAVAACAWEVPAMLDSRSGLWAVVLAGGEGVRLRSLARELYGEARPKQYCALIGPKSMLRVTLDRVAQLIPPARTVLVTQAGHASYVEGVLAGHPPITVLAQPCNRGTAAGMLLAAHWIRTRDPGAVVAVFPADHFIVEESIFMSHVAAASAYVRDHPEWLLLLGVRPTEPEPDYGWIEPGERVGWMGGGPVRRVRAFHEKPAVHLARRLQRDGGLWNTFVFAATVAALVEAGVKCLPLLHDRLTRLDLFTGTQYEPWALRQAYLFAPTADFSRAVLTSSTTRLAVAEIPALTWRDLGTPERVARSLGTAETPAPS
jgi:mannose-1-phosphate guanylyltransferase